MIILLYSDVFLISKRPSNSKPLNKINLVILVTDDLGYLQGFFHVKPDKASCPNFLCMLYKFIRALTSYIYTNDFFSPKKFSSQSIKKWSLLIANCLINLLQKLNKNLKKLHFGNSKKIFM